MTTKFVTQISFFVLTALVSPTEAKYAFFFSRFLQFRNSLETVNWRQTSLSKHMSQHWFNYYLSTNHSEYPAPTDDDVY